MMLQQTLRLNRWTLTSITTLVVLLANGAGCVSWKHHLNRDSHRAMVAAEHIGRVYHSPLCGQILPDGHFIKCPGCLRVPVYPEVAMLASDYPLEKPLMEARTDVTGGDDEQFNEQSNDAEEIVPPAPDGSEASVPTLPADIATLGVTDLSAVEPRAGAVVVANDLAQSTATEPVTAAPAALEPSIAVQSQREIQASGAVVAEPAATEPAEAKPAQVATGVHEAAEVAAKSLSISELDRADGPLKVSKAEFAPLENSAGAIDVLEIVKRIPIPSAKTYLVTEVSGEIDGGEIDGGEIDGGEIDGGEIVSGEIVSGEIVSGEIVSGEIVSGEIVSGDDSDTHSRDNSGNVDGFNGAPIAPSIVRTSVAIIKVTTDGDQLAPSDPAATPETGFKPYDEQGPIPVRKVRTEAELVPLSTAVDLTPSKLPTDRADGKSILKANVAKVTVAKCPTSIKPISQGQREPDDHPDPVRRIKLSDLPVAIQR